ncbi:MAG: glycosyltransferase [Clostridia bacterium]|nr:glycosyltransferase [Clostridia bacterium]
MKKILQITNYFYPHLGGIEQTTYDIMQSLKDEDVEQKIICFNEDASDGNYVCHRKETVSDIIEEVEVVRCGCVAKVASQSLSLSYKKQLKKVMEGFQPDIVIFHYPNPLAAHYLLKYKKRNFKFILYWHLDITRQKILGKLFNSQNKRLLERADKIVATSPIYIQGSPYLSKYKNKSTVIPSCINDGRLEITDAIKEKAQKIRNDNEGKILCFSCGRHVPYKGLEYLIKASMYLPDNFSVVIGGKGELTDSLKKMAEGDKKVRFLGRVSNEDLVAYLMACDIYCFPSITKNEAFGIALAEAMYFSKPAVTFTIEGSGVNYVSLNGVTGIECPNRDSKAYADALKKLAENEELRQEYGANARNRVLENFMLKQFKENIQNLIDGLD